MALRNSVIPAALAIAGCLPNDSEVPPEPEQLTQVTYSTPVTGGDCDVEHVTYRVRGEVTREEAVDKSRVAPDGALVVTVSESTSVVDCTEDTVRVATPGAELMKGAFSASRDEFALDVPGMVIGGQRPSIVVQALLDTNDNGTCDEGELVGSIEVDEDELDAIAIALERGPCPTRL